MGTDYLVNGTDYLVMGTDYLVNGTDYLVNSTDYLRYGYEPSCRHKRIVLVAASTLVLRSAENCL
jgi:hypothetical protein